MQEGGIRTPMVVRWPGKIKAGAVSDFAWYFPDVMPTLAELAGAGRHVPKGIDGISIVPTLLGQAAAGRKQTPHDYLFWQHGNVRAARMGKWKAIRRSTRKKPGAAPVELYDLSADLSESKDLAAQHPEVAAKMADIIEKAYTPPRPQGEPKKPKGKRHA